MGWCCSLRRRSLFLSHRPRPPSRRSRIPPTKRVPARDLAKLITATRDYALLHSLSTRREFLVTDWRADRKIVLRNTNFLLHKESWDIVLSKTGYTAAAGKYLLIETTIANRPLLIVLLISWGKLGRYGDSDRIRDGSWASERKIQALRRTFGSY